MAEVVLEPSDAAWFDRFDRERERILSVASSHLLGEFHIGSTAVPGLPAKPVLDVLVVCDDNSRIEAAADALLEDEYELRSRRSDRTHLTRADEYEVFVHLRPRDGETWRDQLVFREFLRENREARATYERAKRAAAADHPSDVDAYTDAKEATIRRLLDRAYEAGYGDRVPSL